MLSFLETLGKDYPSLNSEKSIIMDRYKAGEITAEEMIDQILDTLKEKKTKDK
jgi:hypothetical protein